MSPLNECLVGVTVLYAFYSVTVILVSCICYSALQEAQDIFGVDFDFEDLEQYEEGSEEEDDEEVQF